MVIQHRWFEYLIIALLSMFSGPSFAVDKPGATKSTAPMSEEPSNGSEEDALIEPLGEPSAEAAGSDSGQGLEVREDKEMAVSTTLDPNVWASSLLDVDGAVKIPGSFPRKILVVSEIGSKGEPKMLEIDPIELKAKTFVSLVSIDQIRWGYALNAGLGGHVGATDKKDELTRVLILFKLSGADLVIHCQSGSDSCVMFGIKGESIRRVKAPGLGKPKDPQAVRQWLRKVFGYDAVVLARNGEYALVGGLKPFAGDRLQALALDGSDKRYVMSGQARKGLAVLQLLKRSGQWGIFRIVLGGKVSAKETVPIGTKLIVEASD